MGVFTYGLKELIENSNFLNREERRKRRMNEKIHNLKDHTILCGFGRMGKTIASDLSKSDQNFVIIERDPTKEEELKAYGYLYLIGDASDDNELIEANIDSAKGL